MAPSSGMDIDDILADVQEDDVPQETRDLQALTRAWAAERGAPEILPYPEGLMERTLSRIRTQVESQPPLPPPPLGHAPPTPCNAALSFYIRDALFVRDHS